MVYVKASLFLETTIYVSPQELQYIGSIHCLTKPEPLDGAMLYYFPKVSAGLWALNHAVPFDTIIQDEGFAHAVRMQKGFQWALQTGNPVFRVYGLGLLLGSYEVHMTDYAVNQVQLPV